MGDYNTSPHTLGLMGYFSACCSLCAETITELCHSNGKNLQCTHTLHFHTCIERHMVYFPTFSLSLSSSFRLAANTMSSLRFCSNACLSALF